LAHSGPPWPGGSVGEGFRPLFMRAFIIVEGGWVVK
jgi:hypothetical protein